MRNAVAKWRRATIFLRLQAPAGPALGVGNEIGVRPHFRGGTSSAGNPVRGGVRGRLCEVDGTNGLVLRETRGAGRHPYSMSSPWPSL